MSSSSSHKFEFTTAVQSELFDQNLQLQSPEFERGEMLNPYALSILETIEPFFSYPYRCFPEFPLQLLCNKDEFTRLPIELWRFWVNSRVDIAVMQSTVGTSCRKASLILECQSPWHNLEGAQRRDSAKASIIASAGIPLVYVQYVDYPRVLRFCLAGSQQDVLYNPFNQEGRNALGLFLKRHSL